MIIFTYGADTLRSHRFLSELKNKFIRDLDQNAQSLTYLDGQNISLPIISEAVSAGSLFVKKRLIIIDNVFQNKKTKIFNELHDFLKKISDHNDNIIIFRDEELNTKNHPLPATAKKLFTFLNSQPYSREFPAITGNSLLTFIKQEMATHKKDIAPAAASEIAQRTGGDMWLIASELKKLAYRAETKTISLADVKEMTVPSYDQNIFALTDALSDKNKNLALKILAEQYAAGASDEYLLTMLIRQFKILLQIRTALDNNLAPAKIAGELKLHPFVAQKGSRQAANFSADNLKNYLNLLIRLDWLNKKGQADLRTELPLLMASL